METAGGRALTPARGTLLRVRRSSKLSALALAATGLSLILVGADFAGYPIPENVTRDLALVSAPLAAVLAIRTAAAYWRGPTLLHFPVEYALLCHGGEAEAIRGSANIRGALGGAGHLHRGRLVFPVVAWLAAAVVLAHVALGAADRQEFRRALTIWAFALVARAVLPPRPFWYRERRDGSIVVYPASIRARVDARLPKRPDSTESDRQEARGE